MKVLVTGAAGFSGSAITLALASSGHEVTATVRSARGRLPANVERSGVKVLAADFSRDSLPIQPLDAVVHTAARSPMPGLTTFDLVSANVVATHTVVAHALACGASTFVYLSSLSIYGRIDVPVVDERTPVTDPDPYGLTKLLGEKLVAEAGAPMRSIAIRLPGVLGPGSVRNWLTNVKAAAKQGRDIEIYNPRAPFNNAIHVADLARFVTGLLGQRWSSFDAVNVAASGEISIADAVRIVVDAAGGKSRIHERPERRHSFTVASGRAAERYGYEPAPIRQVLERFARETETR